jgi:hypothetical protein
VQLSLRRWSQWNSKLSIYGFPDLRHCLSSVYSVRDTSKRFVWRSKAVPLHAMVALGGRGVITPHSWPRQ